MSDDIFISEPGVDYSESFPEEKNEVENTQPLVWDQKLPLFGESTNPNHEIFVVPTLEGADADDRWNGSIGDAVMNHARDMSHRQPEMDHYIFMRNGNIFRMEHNVMTPDVDGSRRINKEIISVLTSGDKTTAEDKENVVAFLQSEILEARRSNEEKEDAMDQTLVPYEEWETKPQMTQSWDVPSTPKPIFIYAGNSKQMFYDEFPEDHPDRNVINRFLTITNGIDWDDWNEDTVGYFEKWMNNQTWSVPNVPFHLMDFCKKVSSSDVTEEPVEIMRDILGKIDSEWGKSRSSYVIKQFKASGPMKEMINFYNHNKERHEAGELMLTKVGKLGKSFFKYASSMTSAHWNAYFRLKSKFAPRVCIEGMDFNTASVQEMTRFFKSEQRAKDVFFARPLVSLQKLADMNLIKAKDIKGGKNNQAMISMIKVAGRKSIKSTTTAYMTKVAQKIISAQQNNPEFMTEEEWSTIWQTYRICKGEVEQAIGL